MRISKLNGLSALSLFSNGWEILPDAEGAEQITPVDSDRIKAARRFTRALNAALPVVGIRTQVVEGGAIGIAHIAAMVRLMGTEKGAAIFSASVRESLLNDPSSALTELAQNNATLRKVTDRLIVVASGGSLGMSTAAKVGIAAVVGVVGVLAVRRYA